MDAVVDDTQENILKLLNELSDNVTPFPVKIESLFIGASHHQRVEMSLQGIAGCRSRMIMRCPDCGPFTLPLYVVDAVPVFFPDLANLGNPGVQHNYLFVVKTSDDSDGAYYVTTNGIELLTPHGSKFEPGHEATPAMAAWFDSAKLKTRKVRLRASESPDDPA